MKPSRSASRVAAARAALTLAAVSGAAVLLASCHVELSRKDRWADKAKSFQQMDQRRPETTGVDMRVQNPDGTITLNCFLPEHLVLHLRNCLAMAEADLILEQLLSEATKEEYAAQNRDPREAVDWLLTNQRDVILLLNRMTGGLSSPDVSWQSMGNGYRLILAPHLQRTFRFTKLDVVRESGQFRLLLIS